MFLLTLQSLHFSDMIATAFLHILQCVFALSALGINNGHDSKTSLPKRLMMSDLILDGMLLHYKKTLSSIFVTQLGILMLVRERHRLKALFPICYTIGNIYSINGSTQLKSIVSYNLHSLSDRIVTF